MAKHELELSADDAFIIGRALLHLSLPSDTPKKELMEHIAQCQIAVQLFMQKDRFDRLLDTFQKIFDKEVGDDFHGDPPTQIIKNSKGELN